MPKLEEVQAVVDGWFQDRIKRGPIAHHTPAYNQAYHALPDLKTRLAALFAKPEADPAASAAPGAATQKAAPKVKKAPKSTLPAAPAATENKE